MTLTEDQLAMAREIAAGERALILAWIRGISSGATDPSLFSWLDRLLYAWWGLRNPSVSMVATRIAIADAIERGDHLKGSSNVG